MLLERSTKATTSTIAVEFLVLGTTEADANAFVSFYNAASVEDIEYYLDEAGLQTESIVKDAQITGVRAPPPPSPPPSRLPVVTLVHRLAQLTTGSAVAQRSSATSVRLLEGANAAGTQSNDQYAPKFSGMSLQT